MDTVERVAPADDSTVPAKEVGDRAQRVVELDPPALVLRQLLFGQLVDPVEQDLELGPGVKPPRTRFRTSGRLNLPNIRKKLVQQHAGLTGLGASHGLPTI